MKRICVITVILLLLLIGVLLGWQYHESAKNAFFHTVHSVGHNAMHSVAAETKSYGTSATIGEIGDVLLHDWVYEDAKKSSGYQFDKMLAKVKPMLEKPDFLIANEESIPAGESMGISSYPIFNSPFEIVDTLKRNGVDLISSANNHAMDKGPRGILSAIQYYEKKGMPYVGINKNQADQKRLRVFNVNGISVAVLAYTFGTNGIPIPDGKGYLVNVIDEPKMIEDIQDARKHAEVVVLSIHWGNEYVRKPNEIQKKLAKDLANAGADIIFGHHPHVLEPIEKIKCTDDRNAVVVYSLGNFLSGQLWDYKDIGGLATVDIHKKIDGDNKTIKIGEVNFEPTFVLSKHFRHYEVLPLKDAYREGLVDHSPDEIENFMFSSISH
ncbi:CapA family protein [Falsibacillus albus]|nr:CapA family protein [Falsibacillus albus]